VSGRDDWGEARGATGRYLGDSTAVAAFQLDGDRRVTRVNGAFLRMAGRGEGPVGRPFLDLLAASSRAAGERLLAGGASTERLQFKGEGPAVFQLTCHAYLDEEPGLVLGDTLSLSDSEVLRAMSRMSGELVNLGRELDRKNRELQRALEEVKTLRGILPICMYCKKIKNDAGLWQRLESYVTEHSEALFSHGICEACDRSHFPPKGTPAD
jgi:hypothetical protein